MDELVQERRNYSGLAIEFHLCCTNPSIWYKEMVMTLAYLQGSCWALPTVTVPVTVSIRKSNQGPDSIWIKIYLTSIGNPILERQDDRKIVLPPQWDFLYLCIWIRSLLISSDVTFTKWPPGGHIGLLLLWVIKFQSFFLNFIYIIFLGYVKKRNCLWHILLRK